MARRPRDRRASARGSGCRALRASARRGTRRVEAKSHSACPRGRPPPKDSTDPTTPSRCAVLRAMERTLASSSLRCTSSSCRSSPVDIRLAAAFSPCATTPFATREISRRCAKFMEFRSSRRRCTSSSKSSPTRSSPTSASSDLPTLRSRRSRTSSALIWTKMGMPRLQGPDRTRPGATCRTTSNAAAERAPVSCESSRKSTTPGRSGVRATVCSGFGRPLSTRRARVRSGFGEASSKPAHRPARQVRVLGPDRSGRRPPSARSRMAGRAPFLSRRTYSRWMPNNFAVCFPK